MTSMLDKKERKRIREVTKAAFIYDDLQLALTSFRAKMHKMLQEPVGGCLAAFHPPATSRGAGHRIKPFVTGEVQEPLEPIKLPKGVERLVIEDVGKEFKEPIVSPKMQKGLRVLELRLDSKGYLYSPKAFDPEWNWQTQAIWLRLIGMGYIDISKRLKKSLNTIKSMFKRLNISKYFPSTSKHDWATIGYGAQNTPSGWRIILHGGGSGILYPSSEMVINKESGAMVPRYMSKVNVGEEISKEYTSFDLKKHKRDVKREAKEETKRKIEVSAEQKTIEINNLLKNIEEGFDPDTGTYPEKEDEENKSITTALKNRKIIIEKQVTQDGIKVIEVRFNPFIDGNYNPYEYSFIISKGKNDKDWGVTKRTSEMHDLMYVEKKTYIASGSLKECKKYCIKELEGERI